MISIASNLTNEKEINTKSKFRITAKRYEIALQDAIKKKDVQRLESLILDLEHMIEVSTAYVIWTIQSNEDVPLSFKTNYKIALETLRQAKVQLELCIRNTSLSHFFPDK